MVFEIKSKVHSMFRLLGFYYVTLSFYINILYRIYKYIIYLRFKLRLLNLLKLQVCLSM